MTFFKLVFIVAIAYSNLTVVAFAKKLHPLSYSNDMRDFVIINADKEKSIVGVYTKLEGLNWHKNHISRNGLSRLIHPGKSIGLNFTYGRIRDAKGCGITVTVHWLVSKTLIGQDKSYKDMWDIKTASSKELKANFCSHNYYTFTYSPVFGVAFKREGCTYHTKGNGVQPIECGK